MTASGGPGARPRDWWTEPSMLADTFVPFAVAVYLLAPEPGNLTR
jgi:hypothetical protein